MQADWANMNIIYIRHNLFEACSSQSKRLRFDQIVNFRRKTFQASASFLKA